MPRKPSRIDRRAAERLLTGAAADVPDPLAGLLAAAAGPARAGELTGEPAAVAAFAEATRRHNATTAPKRVSARTVKIAAAAAAIIAATGVAAVAATGHAHPPTSDPAVLATANPPTTGSPSAHTAAPPAPSPATRPGSTATRPDPDKPNPGHGNPGHGHGNPHHTGPPATPHNGPTGAAK